MKTFFKTALLLASASMLLVSCSSSTPKSDNGAAAIENIMTRTSIRDYTDQSVDDATVETLLRAAMAAPTAVNNQPWQFVVIRDRAVLDSLPGQIRSMRMLSKAQLAVVVCGDMSRAMEGEGREYWIQDCSAATENLLLAAHALGLGAVWCGVYPQEAKIELLTKTLALAPGIIPMSLISIGYPAENSAPKDKWHPEYVHYEKY